MADMDFVNRICPYCKNPNYVVLLYMESIEDYSQKYRYKCLNCHRYFNDDFYEKLPLESTETAKEGEKERNRMTREEFMREARETAKKILAGKENGIMNLVQQAWAEGKRNAEVEAITEIVRQAYDQVKQKDEVVPCSVEKENPKGCTYYEHNNKKPYCTHECDGCVWYR